MKKQIYMELLTTERTEYYLNAGLETLHRESMEWIHEVEFWMDEMVFLYKLIQEKKRDGQFPTLEIADAEKQLIFLHSERADKLRKSLHGHERLLANLLRSESMEEQGYRRAHEKIYRDLSSLKGELGLFKRRVFQFVTG